MKRYGDAVAACGCIKKILKNLIAQSVLIVKHADDDFENNKNVNYTLTA